MLNRYYIGHQTDEGFYPYTAVNVIMVINVPLMQNILNGHDWYYFCKRVTFCHFIYISNRLRGNQVYIESCGAFTIVGFNGHYCSYRTFFSFQFVIITVIVCTYVPYRNSHLSFRSYDLNIHV